MYVRRWRVKSNTLTTHSDCEIHKKVVKERKEVIVINSLNVEPYKYQHEDFGEVLQLFRVF